jgi:glycosyltransferase involved in cell wall biosynthesis
MNSISGIERCLTSLKAAGVGQIIVVDAYSTDGTRQVAEKHADLVLEDEGKGLGNARNIGIQQTQGTLILNMGSDNVLPPDQLDIMIATLTQENLHGVSAQTRIEGSNYPSKGLNAWRQGRFRPGSAAVIGTPTLFIGEMLRAHPYDPSRTFSDDSELCERWATQFNSRFAISKAEVLEIGKTSWREVFIRCRMYGISDAEIFTQGISQGWNAKRKIRSVLHPLKSDLLTPMGHLPVTQAVTAAPFLLSFTAARYHYWARAARKK